MSKSSGRGTAVVIGAGIAGLSAAKALSDAFEQVVVVDRDELPDSGDPRRGVPQGQHSHILLVAGQQALGELFPGLVDELAERGAVIFDSGEDVHLYRLGAAWNPVHSGQPFVSMTRPLLEYTLRRRVAAVPNVTIRADTSVSGLGGSDGRVTEVLLDGDERLAADLVVDSTGRGARSDRWLSALGFPTPEVEEVKVNVGYVSRLYRAKPGDLPVQAAFVQPTPPAEKRIGAALLVEGDRWLVSVGGWHRDYPAADEEGFRQHAESLPDPIIAKLISQAEPLTEPVAFQYPANRRRHFELLETVPSGYLALGDSLCSFNPLYGQGMTCAAQEALALGKLLTEQEGVTAELSKAFYQAAAGVLFVPWQAAIGGDFDYAETAGSRPAAAELFGRYSTQAQLAAQVSGEVRKVILQVQHLLVPPMALWAPSVLAEVVRAARHAPEGTEPEFGHGGHGRALWTAHDRDAERIRAALREAGCREFDDRQTGFAVEGGEPILVACLDGDLIAAGELDRYAEAIGKAGFTATPDADDPTLLRVVPSEAVGDAG
ncbi:FAD-dependent oxidoreductase [Streptomyces sp. NPDC001595]|uniref:FAD-dependent oxidoreductase n=1 Tax=Streptomyces sp. NPDC001532 TaxID=3154520 RepID=UPI0033188AB5